MKGVLLFSFLTVLGGQFPSCNSCTRSLDYEGDYSVSTVAIEDRIEELKSKGFVINPKVSVETFLSDIDTISLNSRYRSQYYDGLYHLYGRVVEGVQMSNNVFNIDPSRRLDCQMIFQKLNKASENKIKLKELIKLEVNKISLNYLIDKKEFTDTLYLSYTEYYSNKENLFELINDNLMSDSLGMILEFWDGKIEYSQGPFLYKDVLTIGVFKENYDL